MKGYEYKVIKINKDTNEVETIIEKEEFIMIAKTEANNANNTKKENEEVKLLNWNNEEIDYKNTRKVNQRNYRTNTRVLRNNYIKLY